MLNKELCELCMRFLDLDAKSTLNIGVIGDAMLDEYYYVDANRVSPEFPIPVMTRDSMEADETLPGGAANVCCQFKHFNVDTKLFSFVNDEARTLFQRKNINVDGCVDTDDLPIKKRFYQGQFPLCRLDIEDASWIRPNHQRKLLDKFKYLPSEPNIIVFSDYDKGVLSNKRQGILNNAKQEWLSLCEDAITIVDPKHGPAWDWRGCSIFKPNQKEAAEMSGLTNWQEQCDYFMNEVQCQAVIITQGSEGLVGKTMNGHFEYRPDNKVFAESVIGAGDCFVAFLAMLMGHCIDIVEAAKLAFHAGSIYVQRKHNQPVAPFELISLFNPIASKFRKPVKTPEKKLVFANGCFDLLHRSHIDLLNWAKSLGDELVVALNDDEGVKRLKGDTRPVFPLAARMHMIASLACVDYVVPFSEDDPRTLLEELKPDCLVKGGDYKPEEIIGKELVKEIKIFPKKYDDSTTNIITNNEGEVVPFTEYSALVEKAKKYDDLVKKKT